MNPARRREPSTHRRAGSDRFFLRIPKIYFLFGSYFVIVLFNLRACFLLSSCFRCLGVRAARSARPVAIDPLGRRSLRSQLGPLAKGTGQNSDVGPVSGAGADCYHRG